MANKFEEIPEEIKEQLFNFNIRTKGYLIFRIASTINTKSTPNVGVNEVMKRMCVMNDYIYVNPNYKQNDNFVKRNLVESSHPFVGAYNWRIEDLIQTGINKTDALVYNFNARSEYGYSDFKPMDNSKKKEEFIKKFEDFDKTPELKDITAENFSSPKKDLNTKLTYMEKGCFRCEEFLPYSSGIYTDDTTPLKDDTEDIRLFIPVQWVSWSGYNESFVCDWVNHLKSILCVDINYLGIKEFGGFETTVNYQKNFLLTKNSFYCVQIPGDELKIHKQFILFMLRGLYHNYYNNVPGLTVQIMNLEKVSFIKAYLLALMSVDLEGKFFIRCGLYDNKNTVPYITNYTDITERLTKYKTLNSFDTCIITAEQFSKLRDHLIDKDFDKALDFFKDIKSEPARVREPNYKNMMADVRNPFEKYTYKLLDLGAAKKPLLKQTPDQTILYAFVNYLTQNGINEDNLNFISKQVDRFTFTKILEILRNEGNIGLEQYVKFKIVKREYKKEPNIILDFEEEIEKEIEPEPKRPNRRGAQLK